jgi:GNAT superfamily N-acetyltransferase
VHALDRPWRHDHHGTGRAARDGVRHAAEHRRPHVAAATRADHDERRVLLAAELDDAVGRRSDSGPEGDRGAQLLVLREAVEERPCGAQLLLAGAPVRSGGKRTQPGSVGWSRAYDREMRVERVAGADEVQKRLGLLLASDEARHNLAFGILATARAHPDVYPELDGWVVRDGSRLVGGALRTPPHNLVVLQPAEDRALGALAVAIEDELPGVVAAVPEVDLFASAWAERHGLRAVTRFDQRIYVLRALVPPGPTPGAMRLANPRDRELALEWVRAFADEASDDDGVDAARIERSVDARIAGAEAGLALWEFDGRPVSLAGFGGPTPSGIRIGPVYTPPELRGRGYGTAVTAAASELLLERGYRFCFLYTDLANPTSNAIYRRIGYEPVCDSREVAFVG